MEEIKNPILPLQLGKAYVTETEHSFLYHVNISIPLAINSNVQNKILLIKTYLENHQNHFSLLLTQKLDIAIMLNSKIQNKLLAISHVRNKRGIFDGIGTVSKYLFGTMDANDFSYINKYLDALSKDELEFKTALSKQQTILKDIVNKYTEMFDNIQTNQKQIVVQLNELIKDSKRLDVQENILSLSLTIDKILLELQILLDIMNTLETALSFAKLHVTHPSIIETHEIQSLISILCNNYNQCHLPKFDHLVSYYLFFATDVVISDNIVLFRIHVPITTTLFKYFQFFPVFQSNFTLIPETQYLLFDSANYWNTDEPCHAIENTFFCAQESLVKGNPCLLDIVRNGVNKCPITKIQLTETIIHKISSSKILVNPKEPVAVQSSCDHDGFLVIHNPSVIDMDGCSINIKNRTFWPNTVSLGEKVFTIPNLDVTLPNQTEKGTFKISHINQANIKNIKALTEDIGTFSPMVTVERLPTEGILTTILVLLLICILCYPIWKKFQELKKRLRRNPVGENPEQIELPSIVHLRDGGII